MSPAHRLEELLVVTHTHWDREWYHTAERFRQRLVRLIDELLDDPPTAGESFLLDGQAILVEDYLAVRPERAAELSALLHDGRLEAGPWYVLADELIPSGEALVRNLLMGRDVVRRLRGRAPDVLYCPDSFGHPAVLPDLAAGFGCDVVVLWRGYGGVRWPSGDTVRWTGAGGATVHVYHLPRDGYEFGSSLPVALGEAATRWARISAELAARAVTGTAILLNGADHHFRQRDQRGAVRALAAAGSPVRVSAASLGGAVQALVAAAASVELPTVRGELRDSYDYTWTLQGTPGTRAAQKRRNAMTERLLVHDVEPWVALSIHGGLPSARALVRSAWRTLLQAHPHDTLCGTSIDAVARAMDARLESAEVQGIGLRTDALHALVEHDEDHARTHPEEWAPSVLLRNPVARRRGGVVELTLRAKLADVAVGPGSGHRQGARSRTLAWKVEGVPLQILVRTERIELTEAPRSYPDADLVAEVRAVGWLDPVGGYTVDVRPQRGSANVSIPHPVVATARALDNGRIRVEVSEAGEVSVEDRALRRRIADVVSFERRRDLGDLYTPSLREEMPAPRLRRVRLGHRGPLRGEIALDYVFGGRGEGGVCRVTLRLDADSRALTLVVDGENRERDHRLRLRIATGIQSQATLADAAFMPVERRPTAIDERDALVEHVVPTAPLHRWVSRFEGDLGATLCSDGLAEYESLGDGAVAVTLVRAVGELSRADLPERPGHAGWPAPTPEAQCIGPYSARFALWLHGPDSPARRDEIRSFAEDVLLPLTGETLRSNTKAPRVAGGLELHGAGLAFSAAAPAQRDGWIVLRCVNQRDTPAHGEWRLARPIEQATMARLDETPLAALAVEQGNVRFEAAPRGIVTILVR
jgi:alpha-mannosidase